METTMFSYKHGVYPHNYRRASASLYRTRKHLCGEMVLHTAGCLQLSVIKRTIKCLSRFTDYHPAKFYYTREGPAWVWLTKLQGFISRSQCLTRCKRKRRTKCSLVTDWEGMAKE